jgi:hypothetical protein
MAMSAVPTIERTTSGVMAEAKPRLVRRRELRAPVGRDAPLLAARGRLVLGRERGRVAIR